MAVLFLTVEDVESLHDEQLARYGGSAGVRDRGALESAVATPQATFGGEHLHATVFEMAAAYAFHIAQNGLNAALVFLGLNGWDIDDPDVELHEAMIAIAAGTLTKSGLASLFESLAAPYSGDE